MDIAEVGPVDEERSELCMSLCPRAVDHVHVDTKRLEGGKYVPLICEFVNDVL